jgi:hypothetical protein
MLLPRRKMEMRFKYINYEENKLYKMYPEEHELKVLTAENLRLLLASARFKIRRAAKQKEMNLINKICFEVELIYKTYSVQNKTSIKYYEAFNIFVEENKKKKLNNFIKKMNN